jgi:hypothetical protein
MTARPYIDAPRRIKARLPRKRAMWGRASTRRYVAAEAPGSFTEGSSKKIGGRYAPEIAQPTIERGETAGRIRPERSGPCLRALGAAAHRSKPPGGGPDGLGGLAQSQGMEQWRRWRLLRQSGKA